MRYSVDAALAELKSRSEHIRRRKRRRVTQTLSGAAFGLAAAFLALLRIYTQPEPVEQGASVFGSFRLSAEAGGFVLVGVIAFFLGTAVTILCVERRKKTREAGHKPEPSHEEEMSHSVKEDQI